MFKTLKQKLLALVLFAIGGTLLVAGVALSVLLEHRHAENNRQHLQALFDRSAGEFQNLLRSSARSRDELRGRDEIRETLYLISAYEDADNYQPLIFDEEKKKLSHWLLNHARSSSDSQVSAYDDKGVLVAFAKLLPGGSLRGIVTRVDGSPQILVLSGDSDTGNVWQRPSSEQQVKLPRVSGLRGETGTWFTARSNTLAAYSLGYLKHRFADDRELDVGSIHVEREVSGQFLRDIAARFNGLFSLIGPDGLVLGDKLTLELDLKAQSLPDLFNNQGDKGPWHSPDNPFLQAYKVDLADGRRFYLVGAVDVTAGENQASLVQNVSIGVFLIAALVLLPVVLWFAHHLIVGPISKLEASAQALGKGDYELDIPASGSAEVDKLAKALHDTARVVHEREVELRHYSDTLEQQVSARTADLNQTNASLSESRRMLQLVMDNIPQYVFWKDRNSLYLGCNANFLKVASMDSVEELVGKSDYDLPWTREESDSYRRIDKEIMDADEPRYRILESVLTASGEEIMVETNKIPLHDNNGQVIGILGTFEDVTERFKYEQQLRKAVADSDASRRGRFAFLSRMSHEIRTPVNGILDLAQGLLLPGQQALTDQQRSQAQEIASSGQQLLQLIAEVLELSDIESQDLELKVGPVKLDTLVVETGEQLATLAQQHQVRLIMPDEKQQPLQVRADPTRLRQVLTNLFSNAIQYNRPGGTVRVETEATDVGTLRISVIDTGPGIPKDMQSRLFQPFERLDAKQKGIDGTGLGLLMVRELVTRMGGEAGMDSKLGQGSVFWFTLPLLDRTPSASENGEQPAHGSSLYQPANPRTVLYVEDNRANFRLVQELVSGHTDYDLVWAESGEQGLITATQLRPAVVLMDMHMPGLSGQETFAKLQASAETHGIPVIALSANTFAEDISSALAMGFRAYLTKPVKVRELLAELEQYIPPA